MFPAIFMGSIILYPYIFPPDYVLPEPELIDQIKSYVVLSLFLIFGGIAGWFAGKEAKDLNKKLTYTVLVLISFAAGMVLCLFMLLD
ncbi:hypothetical protein MsAg5_08770 [Methanosarcinaceae archaeon Ag5]|uniref:Uncharacterized protein n=1 Tax=Methanolapillus africanus TaxID=3028297 RepID=A0AAE4SDQ4_9EURY|nr:hypothetical protein [Methanosarcinaceae archaeon Ag5]